MAKTFNLNVDLAGGPDSYTVQTKCRKLIAYEQAQAGTTNYDVYAPPSSATFVTKPAGSKYELEKAPGLFFTPGDKPFAIGIAASSVQFDVEES